MVKFGLSKATDVGIGVAVLVVGLGMVGQGGLISGMFATILGYGLVIVGIIKAITDLMK